MDESPSSGNMRPEQEHITELLAQSTSGSEEACDKLLTLVYTELHALARSRMRGEGADHTLSATALVNEAYVRLFRATGQEGGDARHWASRSNFFAAAATAMRRILIDHARSKATAKRGGPRRVFASDVMLDVLEAARTLDPAEVLALDDAISRLKEVDDRAAEVVRLRFYGGLEIADVAAALETSDRTVKRDWEFARAWLKDALMTEQPDRSCAEIPKDEPDGG